MKARPIEPGVTFFATRRTRGREFRLLPSERTDEIIGYLFAVLSNEAKLEVSALCVLSNHYHCVAFDRCGNRPDFLRDFHSMSARHLNAAYGDSESMWSSQQTSLVYPEGFSDTLSKIGYTASNPVAAGCVKYGHRWPGIWMVWGKGKGKGTRTFKRPKGFLQEFAIGPDGEARWPEEVTLKMHRPRGAEELSDDEVRERLSAQIHADETAARKAVFDSGRKFMGATAVLQQSRYAKPRTREPRGRISPRVACRDKWRRIERLQANRAWGNEYTDCRVRFAAGDRDVVFPYGTFKLRRTAGVNVHGPPA